MSHRVEPLHAEHVLDTFACGTDGLDTWLRDHARTATGQGTRTYVLVGEADGAVVGYFAVAPHLAAREEMPRSVGRGAPQRIPAILLAKLALDRQAQGQGLGADLLVSALRIIVTAARSAGGRLIVVDAIDDNAAAFYRAHDFRTSPGNPRCLLMKLSTAARTLGEPWP